MMCVASRVVCLPAVGSRSRTLCDGAFFILIDNFLVLRG